MTYELLDQFHVAANIERVWGFFSTPDNLPKITPPWLRFTIRGDVAIQKDAELDYLIRWLGMPLRWTTRIIAWEPPSRFIDLQTRGPYALWHHEHRFEPDERGVVCFDRVIYRLPMGPLGPIGHALMVRRQLMSIFRYRRETIGRLLGKMTPIQTDVTIRRIKPGENTIPNIY